MNLFRELTIEHIIMLYINHVTMDFQYYNSINNVNSVVFIRNKIKSAFEVIIYELLGRIKSLLTNSLEQMVVKIKLFSVL